MEFEDLIAQLLSPTAAGLTHSQAEDLIEGHGREVLRQLLHSRALESLFGTVQVEHLGDIEHRRDYHPAF